MKYLLVMTMRRRKNKIIWTKTEAKKNVVLIDDAS
jgi:hypothetical protein